MTIWARIDGNGRPTAFYDDRRQPVPPGCLPIPETVWQAHLTGRRKRHDGHAWVDDRYQPTLDEYKQWAIERITVDYQRAAASGFTCSNGIQMDSTQQAVLLFDAGVRFAELGGAASLEIADYLDATHTVPVAEAKRMVQELAAHVQALLTKKWTLRGRILAAQSFAEVDQVMW